MAVSLVNFQVGFQINGQIINITGLGGGKESIAYANLYRFLSGVGASQAENWYTADTLSGGNAQIAATTALNVDLSGSLTNTLGTVVGKKIKVIFFEHLTPAASAAAQLGGHATAAVPIFGATPDLATAQPYIIVPAGDFVLMGGASASGWAITAASADMLRIYNGGAAAIDYRLAVLVTTT